MDTLDKNRELNQACMTGDYELCVKLVGEGADVNFIDEEVWEDQTPLACAVFSENVNLVKYLIDNGANINERDSCGNNLPLNRTLESMDQESKEIAAIIINEGLDLNIKNNEGWTPLHHAAYHWKINKNKEIIKLMVEKGADLNLKSNDGESPFFLIINNVDLKDEDLNFVEYLVSRGADVKTNNNKNQTLLKVCESQAISEYLILNGANINAQDINYEELLFEACESGNVKIVEEAILSGVDVNTTKIYNQTPLSLAVQFGHREIIEFLISKDAEVNAKIDGYRTESEGIITDRELPLLALLIRSNAWGKYENAYDIAEMLIDKGADVNDNRYPMLIIALNFESREIAKLLINNGADVNQKDIYGTAPILRASQLGNAKEIIELLIKNGADINVKNAEGYTPLMYAVIKKDFDSVKVLIDNGADINVINENGGTALSLANDDQITSFLKKYSNQ